eukprot:Skav206374  [mRNA]  locus=scaffold834:207054:211719:+ [translate_table: standard]
MGLPWWEQLLLESECFDGFKHSSNSTTCNLLVEGIMEVSTGTVMTVKVLKPPGTPAKAAIHDIMHWDEPREVGEFRIRCDKTGIAGIPTPRAWILDAQVNRTKNQNWDFCISSDSLVVPIHDAKKDPLHVLECYAGGYGGWKYALRHLSKHFAFSAQTISIEADAAACCNFAVNHGVPIANGYESLPFSFLDHVTDDLMLHADVSSRAWLGAVSTWHPHIMVVSSPCPPWSAAGEAKGLSTHDGMLLPETIIQAKWLQPDVIILEQVASFQQHPHKANVMRTFHAAGYLHVWTRVVDLQSCTPVKRPRWLSVWRRCDVAFDSQVAYRGFVDLNMTPDMFHAVLPADLCPDWVYLSPEVMALLSNPDFLPPSKRHKANKDPLTTRVYKPSQQLPVFMASYGSQHEFDGKRMQEFGCYAHVLDQEGQTRFWTPFEVCVLHFAIHAVFIPKSAKVAYRHLGNQIAIPHAMIAICHALKSLGWMDIDVEAVHNTLKACRLTVDNVTMNQGSMGTMYVHDDVNFHLSDDHHANIEAFLQLNGALIPHGQWWDIEGLHDLPLAPPATQIDGSVTQVSNDASELASVASSNPGGQMSHADEPFSQCSLDQVTDVDEDVSGVSPEFDISATIPFHPTLSLRVVFQHGEQVFWVSGGVSPQSLPMLWNRPMEISDDQGMLVMKPNDQVPHVVGDGLFVICIVDQRMTIYQLDDPDKIKVTPAELFQRWGLSHGFDAHGVIPHDTQVKFDMLVSDQPICASDIEVSLPVVIAAFQSMHVLYDYHSQDDTWNVILTGDKTARETLASLYARCMHPSTLKQIGRTVQIFRKDTSTIVSFGPAFRQTALPPKLLVPCVAICVTKILLNQTITTDGSPVLFKWKGKPFWEGHMDRCMEAQSLCTLLQVGLAPDTEFKDLRCVSRAKNFASGMIQDLEERGKVTKFHIFTEVAGGTGPNAAKNKLKQQIRNGLASSLLEQGVDLNWIHENMEKIIDLAGVGRLMPILSGPSSVQKDNKIRQVQQIQNFGGNVAGAFLTDAFTALPWVRASQKVSPDELVMLIIGDLPCQTSLPHEEVVIPCKDPNQRPVLMQATMVQFGAKTVSYQSLDKKEIQHAASKVIAFTFWKSDWNDSEWETILTNTSKFVKQKFLTGDGHDTILSTWGRSLRNGKAPGTIHDATSIQVHAAVVPQSFLYVLQLSGYNRIWASPKNESGRVSDDFRVLWMQPQDDMQQLSVKTATLTGIAGLIKGKSSLGLRVQASHFDAAWAVLRPHDAKPSNINTKHVYKLEPLPYGCSPKALSEWGEYVGWRIKPLRASGPRTWIIGSGDFAPEKQLVFNSQLVLPSLLPPKQSSFKSPIVAGPRARPQQKEAMQSVVGEGDPWAAFFNARGSTGLTPAQQPVPPRTLTGPTEQKFQEQDQRLQQLESQLSSVSARQDEHGAQLQNVQKELTATEARISNQVQHSMDALKQDLATSLSGAIDKQSKKFDSSLQQITQLLKKQAKRKSSPPKKDGDDERMEDSS